MVSPVLLVSLYFTVVCFPRARSFAPLRYRSSASALCSATTGDLPLLDFSQDDAADDDSNNNYIFPLPSGNFPEELRTCSIHSATVTLPLHKAVLDAAVAAASRRVGFCCCGGHTTGCVAEIVRWDSTRGELLYRGDYLFRSTDVVTTIPFRTATVEAVETLLAAEAPADGGTASGCVREELSYKDNVVLQEMLDHLTAYTDQAVSSLSRSEEDMSPLEASLQQPPGVDPADQNTMAEERAAIVTILRSSLELFSPATIPFLAVDLLSQQDVSNADRLSLLRCQTVSERIQTANTILQQIQASATSSSRTTAAAVTAPIVDTDLQVGPPQLPVWANRITKGSELEYFWNEEYEWCRGVVVEDPVWIVDEWILTVHFDDDDSTHRLPLTADDKARWRPASSFG